MFEPWKDFFEIIRREYFETYQRTRDHYLFYLAQPLYLMIGSIYKKALVFLITIASTLVCTCLINKADVIRTVIGHKPEYRRQIPITLL